MTVSSPQIQQSNVGIIDTELLHRAVTALLKHHESHTDEKRSLLLGNEERIALHFGLAKVPSNPSSKPVRIEIPHPLHRFKTTTAASTNTSDHGTGIDSSISEQGLEEADVCIIVKESAKPTVQELIERFPTRMGCVKKVLGLDSLRKKFSSYEQRRELLRRYDIFLADDRILPMLGKALGKNFFAAKKQPIPLNIVRQKALPLAVQRSIESTYMFMPTGNCLGVRVGSTNMPIKHIVENCEIASKAVAEKVPCKWGNILSISIKTSQSVALPFYNKSPEEVSRIRKVAGSNGDAVVEKKKRKRQPQSKNPDIPGKETKSCDESSNSKEKVKKKISPLPKALKKQRLAEGLETEGGNEKKLNKAKNDGDDGQKHGKEKPLSKDAKVNNKSQSKTKRSKGSVSAVEDSILDARADNNTTKASSSPKIELSPIKAKEILHGCEKKGVRASKHALDKTEPAEESHAKKDRETIAASATTRPVVEKAVNSDDTDTTNEDFMSSKKFKGAKIGYVFKEGSQGVGYYVDMLPQVDKAALDAVLRKGGVSGKRGKKRRH